MRPSKPERNIQGPLAFLPVHGGRNFFEVEVWQIRFELRGVLMESGERIFQKLLVGTLDIFLCFFYEGAGEGVLVDHAPNELLIVIHGGLPLKDEL